MPRNTPSTTSGDELIKLRLVMTPVLWKGIGSWAGEVSQVGEAPAFERCSEGISEVGCRDSIVKKRLAAHRFVAKDAKGDPVALCV
jgi:hypothetical protein